MGRIFRILASATLAVLVLSCFSPGDPDDADVFRVPQQHIDWPSLANTPWPMLHHDPQFTGRSEHDGPTFGSIFRKVDMGMSFGSAVVGYDSSIFIGGYRELDRFDYEGNLNWRFENGRATESSPIISIDSSILVPFGLEFLSLSASGQLNWSSNIEVVYGLGFNIDMDGNLYFVDETSTLNALSSDGSLLWQLSDERILEGADTAPVFSPDGQTIYVQGDSVSVLAIDINTQSILWTFGDEPLYSSPAIDNAGFLYFTPGRANKIADSIWTIYTLTGDGDINWEFDVVCSMVLDNTEATIDHDGNIYFAYDTLYSFQNDGILRWKYGFENNRISNVSLICDNNNVIYVGTRSRINGWGTTKILAINQDGDLLWELEDNDERAFGPSPALTDNSTLIYPTWNGSPGKLILIR